MLGPDLNGVSSPRLQPSLLPVVVEGLDLSRTIIGRCLGTHVANPTASFVAGMFVTRDANGYIIPCTGAGAVGVAKWNKTNQLYGTQTDEAQVLTGVVATNLEHPLVVVGSVSVVDAVSGVQYALTTDYTVNAANGTVTRTSGSTIPSGNAVLVTYRYAAQSSDLDFNGRNFFNFVDDTATQQGRIAVIQGFSTLFSAAYDTSQVYAVNQPLYVGANSYPTSVASGNAIGQVTQIPTADDPYLGYELTLVA